jgi:hypothetical protein
MPQEAEAGGSWSKASPRESMDSSEKVKAKALQALLMW